MNIGIDIDDTICKTGELLGAYALQFELERGFVMPENFAFQHNVEQMFGWTQDDWLEFKDKYLDLVHLKVQPKPLAKEVIDELKNDGHTIKIITARYHETPNSERITRQWLKDQGINHDGLIFDCQEKEIGCRKESIDVFIDDNKENCLAVADAGIKTFIFDALWNQDFTDSRVKRVHVWPQFYQQIAKIGT